jgi:ribosomal RNA-processing protein 17
MSGKRSNVELLTEGASYIQRAKKARKDQVEAVKFDDDARREWLTGFSKRKKAKADERRQKAKERDRKEHLEERAKVCFNGASVQMNILCGLLIYRPAKS